MIYTYISFVIVIILTATAVYAIRLHLYGLVLLLVAIVGIPAFYQFTRFSLSAGVPYEAYRMLELLLALIGSVIIILKSKSKS